MNLELIEQPEQAIYDRIQGGIRAYNQQFLPSKEQHLQVALLAKDESGELLGGMNAYFYATCVFVEHLWVDENQRKSGLGSALIKRIEEEAKSRQVTDMFLDTYSFQARDFYIKHGFTEVGKYTNFPAKGIDKYFLQKAI